MNIELKTSILISCFLFILSTSQISAQILNINEINGFKELKLGDPFSKWQAYLGEPRVIKDGLIIAQYKGDCCKYAFNLKIENIDLYFENDKLVWIELFTIDKFTGVHFYDYAYYSTIFNSYFGKYNAVIQKPRKDGDFEEQWIGEKVILDVTSFFGSSVDGYQSAFISVIDYNYLKNNAKQGF